MTIKTNDVLTNFKGVAAQVIGGAILTVSRPKNENIILISEAQFEEYVRAKRNEEYLAKLHRSEEDYRAGRMVTKSLDELKAMEDRL